MKERKTAHLGIRVTPKVKKQFEAKCRKTKRDVSEKLTELILNFINEEIK